MSKTKCPTCNSSRIYHEKYDSYFCPKCNKWLEEKCNDVKCIYCIERPDKPLKEKK